MLISYDMKLRKRVFYVTKIKTRALNAGGNTRRECEIKVKLKQKTLYRNRKKLKMYSNNRFPSIYGEKLKEAFNELLKYCTEKSGKIPIIL